MKSGCENEIPLTLPKCKICLSETPNKWKECISYFIENSPEDIFGCNLNKRLAEHAKIAPETYFIPCPDRHSFKPCILCDIACHILSMKASGKCESFGFPTYCRKCLACDEKTFNLCNAISVTIKANYSTDIVESRKALEEQIFDLTYNEEDGCFGAFAFSETCNSCDFTLFCLRESGITGDINCKHKDESNCQLCPIQDCQTFYADGNIESPRKLIPIKPKKNIYKNFFSLKEIRMAMMLFDPEDKLYKEKKSKKLKISKKKGEKKKGEKKNGKGKKEKSPNAKK
jgi:hypothetical protein